MKKKDLKVRLIDDEQVFENLSANETKHMMASGGTSNYGSCSSHGIIRINQYNWTATCNITWYGTINFTNACGSAYRDVITINNLICDGNISGSSTYSTQNENTIELVCNYYSFNVTGLHIDDATEKDFGCIVSFTLAGIPFSVTRITKDKEGTILKSSTLISTTKDLKVTFEIDYDPYSETLYTHSRDVSLDSTNL